MGIFDKVEAAMQGAVEGSFGRVFRTRLQPVELANKLARAMDENLQLAPGRQIAPTIYDVSLSQRDFELFDSMAQSLGQKLSDSLISVARERGYMLTSRPIVRFHLDERLVTGQPRIATSFRDAQFGATEDTGGTVELSPEERANLEREAREQAQRAAESIPPAWLTLYRPVRGKPMQITKPVIHIGRHLSNDIVVNDKRVSRYHAELRYERGQFVVYDLGSTNGVGINGVVTHQPVPIKNNDMISIGSHDFVFQRR